MIFSRLVSNRLSTCFSLMKRDRNFFDFLFAVEMAGKASGKGFLSKIKGKFRRKNSEKKEELDYNATQDIDTNTALILSHRQDEQFVEPYLDELKSADEVYIRQIHDFKEDFESNPSAENNTKRLVSYMESLNGILVICSAKFLEILNDTSIEESEDVQISCENFKLNIKALKLAISESENLKNMVITFKLPELDGSVPEFLAGKELIKLTCEGISDTEEDKTIYELMLPQIISRLKEKRASKRLISQNSVTEK